MSNLKIEFNIDTEDKTSLQALNNFVTSLTGEARPPVSAAETPVKKVTAKKTTPVTKEVEVAEVEVAEVEVAEIETVDSGQITIEEIRDLLGKRLTNHREAAKAELKRLGANNVTSLDKGKYADFHKFLSNLQD